MTDQKEEEAPVVIDTQEEPGDPWWLGLRRLVGSAKAWVTLAASLGAVGMHVHGDVSGDKTLTIVAVLVGLYIGGHALEDAAEKLRGHRALANGLQGLGAALSSLPQYLPQIMDMVEKSRAAAVTNPATGGVPLDFSQFSKVAHCPTCKKIAIGRVPGDPCDTCGKPMEDPASPAPTPEGKA